MSHLKTTKYHVWEPLKGISDNLDYIEFKFAKGLQLKFEDRDGNEINFIYDQLINGMFVWASRFTEESIRGDIDQLALQARINHFNSENKSWCLYKVSNSDFLEWYDELPGPGSDLFPEVEHHVFMSSEIIFDVLSEYEPKVIVKPKEKR